MAIAFHGRGQFYEHPKTRIYIYIYDLCTNYKLCISTQCNQGKTKRKLTKVEHKKLPVCIDLILDSRLIQELIHVVWPLDFFWNLPHLPRGFPYVFYQNHPRHKDRPNTWLRSWRNLGGFTLWLLRHGHQELRSCCSHQDATKAQQHEVAIATVALPVASLSFELKSWIF